MIRRRRYRSIEALDQWDKDCVRRVARYSKRVELR